MKDQFITIPLVVWDALKEKTRADFRKVLDELDPVEEYSQNITEYCEYFGDYGRNSRTWQATTVNPIKAVEKNKVKYNLEINRKPYIESFEGLKELHELQQSKTDYRELRNSIDAIKNVFKDEA